MRLMKRGSQLLEQKEGIGVRNHRREGMTSFVEMDERQASKTNASGDAVVASLFIGEAIEESLPHGILIDFRLHALVMISALKLQESADRVVEEELERFRKVLKIFRFAAELF